MRIPKYVKFRGAIYRQAARDVTLDDLDADSKKLVMHLVSQHKNVQPGTPEYDQLIKKYIERVLLISENQPPTQVMF